MHACMHETNGTNEQESTRKKERKKERKKHMFLPFQRSRDFGVLLVLVLSERPTVVPRRPYLLGSELLSNPFASYYELYTSTIFIFANISYFIFL